MREDRISKIKNEIANEAVEMCGSTGVLNMVDNDSLSGDVKYRHQQALNEANKFKDADGNVNPNIQAIFARIYGLI